MLLFEFSLAGACYVFTLLLNKGLTGDDLKKIPVLGKFITLT